MMLLLFLPLYVALSFERNSTAPSLTIIAPLPNSTTEKPFTTLQGAATPSSEVFINKDPIVLRDTGAFTERIALHAGLNAITITARRFGIDTVVTRTIVYNP